MTMHLCPTRQGEISNRLLTAVFHDLNVISCVLSSKRLVSCVSFRDNHLQWSCDGHKEGQPKTHFTCDKPADPETRSTTYKMWKQYPGVALIQIWQSISHFPFNTGTKTNFKHNKLIFNMANPNPYPKQYIGFPGSWNDKWSNEGVTDLENAKNILYDFNSNDDSDEDDKVTLWEILHESETPGTFKNVSSLVTAIQNRVFRNQHSSFDSNWLLHRMRFILLKCQPNLPQCAATDNLINFFFDVSLSRGVQVDNTIPSHDIIALELPGSLVKIVIIGGGPTGLLAAITLAERVRCRKRVQIHVYDKRWINQTYGKLHFTVYPEDERRRDQVITLQDNVKELFSKETKNFLDFGLGKHGAEVVWPESSNLQIRKVEDALLKRAQDSIFDELIHLHGADITDEETLIREAGDDFHLLLGTDGANSWIRRRYFPDEEEPCGRSLALGVALDRGDRGLSRPQALNIFLTLCQTRYLLNASDRDGTGYLNMLLKEEEYDRCVSLDGTPADFRTPACIRTDGVVPPGFAEGQVFAPYDENSSFWQSIADGLRLFGFEQTDVKSIVRIPINLMGVKTATKTVSLDSETRRRPHCLVSLVGDSALTHHFWPGRGMNSGIKAAIAWSNQVSDLILERNEGLFRLEPRALEPFLDFMKDLRVREHSQRSLVIQENCGSPEIMEKNLRQAHTLDEHDRKIAPELRQRVVDFAKSLEGRGTPRWPHHKIKGLGGIVMKILSQLRTRTKAEMYHSGPWPIEGMRAPEVHPPEPRIPNLPRSRVEDDICKPQDGYRYTLPTTRELTRTTPHQLHPSNTWHQDLVGYFKELFRVLVFMLKIALCIFLGVWLLALLLDLMVEDSSHRRARHT